MLDELYMQDLANAMRMPDEVVPTGKVTVSGPQVETAPKQPEMGTITGIPQTAFEKALETSGVKLSELGDMIDQSAPGTLNTLLGREVPIIGNLKLRDFLPFVGSKDEGKLTGTPAALIAAGTGQPLRGQPVVGSSIGPDGQRYYGTSGSPAMLNEDVGTAMVDVATLGLGKPLAAGAKKAVKATKNMPVGMSTKAVGQGVDELGFYSAAKQAVDAIQQPKGTGQQFLKQIEKTPGVKPDEIKWTGLDEFLKSKKTVTKAEVQEYLDKNKVEIKEVSLGEPTHEWQGNFLVINKTAVAKIDEDASGAYVLKDNINNKTTPLKSNRLDKAVAEAEEIYGVKGLVTPYEGKPKFDKYTLPGGENYREILLTLPSNMSAYNKFSDELIAKYGQGGFDNLPLTNVERARLEKFYANEDTPQFKSGHFDQPNILAHLRVNDRVIDGKKTLFVEEVQSDWHQAGRKKGYQGDMSIEQARQKMLDNGYSPEAVANSSDEDIVKMMTQYGVPDAPFKTTWSDLSMKRVIQLASEGGYDRIAFTTGKTQAERFDLSKQIGQINARPTPDGKISLEALTPDMGEQVIQRVVMADELDDIVGKEIAEKIRTQIEYPKSFDDRGKSVELSGLDLKVGGEGMKGFYDDILPKFLDKYAKKWDAKTGVTEMKVGQDKVERGMVAPGIDFVGEDKVTKAPSVQVNYIDVTPKMRESVVTKGQPMFAIGAGGAGAAATQEENK